MATVSATVPVISLADPDAAARFDDAARNVGFLQIADHGVPDEVTENMLTVSGEFFARPLSEKQRFVPPSPDINRGYAAKGTEGLAYSVGMETPPDLFEAFNLGPHDVDPASALAQTVFFAENIWPSDQPAFRDAITNYFVHVRSLAHRLTDLFAVALELPDGYFRTYTDYSTDTLRINHYQRGAAEGDPLPGQFGMGAHTDYGIVTILYADPVPGLQILAPNGEWVDVQPEPGCFLVNLGDLTAEWTNDRWRSTLHRVQPPAPGIRRRSVAFFHDGNFAAHIECLPTCTSPTNPPRYAPVTAGDHLMAKLLGPRTLSVSAHTVDTSADRR
jgi:isopenicillin N synthase-like dioxygenase